MGSPRIYTLDMLRRTAAYIRSSTTGYATAARATDGNPANRWALGAASGSFIWYQSPGILLKGWGVEGHTCAGGAARLWYGASESGPWFAAHAAVDINTNDGYLYYPGDSEYGWGPYTYWKWEISGADANVEIGVLSFLADYGYDVAGSELTDGGAIFDLANEAGFGVLDPIGNVSQATVRESRSAGGFRRRIGVGSTEEVFRLRFAGIRADAEQEWGQVKRSFSIRERTVKTNPGWENGLWLTLPDYDVSDEDARRGYYVDAEEAVFPNDTDKTGRAFGELIFRERQRG